MIILLIFFISFNLYAMDNQYDTTQAPRQAVSAQELNLQQQGTLHYKNASDVNSPFILELHNAQVYEDGHIITNNHQLLFDTVIKYPEKPLAEYHMLNRKDLPIAQHFNGTLAVIASPGAQCYYHWMFQILPRLKILKDLHIDFDALYIEPIMYSFQLETLVKVGIDAKKIIFAKPDTQIIAETLLVPSIAVKEPNLSFPAWVIEFLRSEFLDAAFIEKFKNFKKIYISRSKASLRRIVNEQEFVQFLSEQGFITLNLEDYSLAEQAAIIHNADIIVSPHGSALSNLAFAHKSAHVIEIFNQNGFNRLFYHLAQSVGLNHRAIVCSDEKLDEAQQAHEDISVDIHQIEEVLKNIS